MNQHQYVQPVEPEYDSFGHYKSNTQWLDNKKVVVLPDESAIMRALREEEITMTNHCIDAMYDIFQSKTAAPALKLKAAQLAFKMMEFYHEESEYRKRRAR